MSEGLTAATDWELEAWISSPFPGLLSEWLAQEQPVEGLGKPRGALNAWARWSPEQWKHEWRWSR